MTTIVNLDLGAALQKPTVAVIASLDPHLPCKQAVPLSGMPNQKRGSAETSSAHVPTTEAMTVTTIRLREGNDMPQPL